MWLAETAVDYATLEAPGRRDSVHYSPSQAQLASDPTDEQPVTEWHEVGSQIDPTRPYRCFLPRQPNRDYIDIFFYDGPSRGIWALVMFCTILITWLDNGWWQCGDHRPTIDFRSYRWRTLVTTKVVRRRLSLCVL